MSYEQNIINKDNIINISNIDEYKIYKNNIKKTDINVNIFVAEWCAPCQRIKPIINQYIIDYSKHKNIKFIYINIDKCITLSEDFKISALPTIIIVKDEKQLRLDYNEIKMLSKFIDNLL